MEYLWIALGSALGGVARYWLSGVVARRFGEAFPVGTLIVNVTGSFVIGFAAAVSDPAGRMLMSVSARRFIMAGLCGGYTTFSSFSLQTLNLAEDGESAVMLMAKSRHKSLQTLQRYARPGPEAVAAMTARHDPATRRQQGRTG